MQAAIWPPAGGEGEAAEMEPTVKGMKHSQEPLNLFGSLNPPLPPTSFS